jgi:50S ribosomal protein L16 3-hydroxylase
MIRRDRPGLRELLKPLPAAVFLDRHWASRHAVVHGRPARLPAVFGAPELASLEAILACPHAYVKAWLSGPGAELIEVPLHDEQALALHRGRQATVVVDAVEVAAVSALMERMKEELETPQPKIGCNVFVSPAGAGTRMHFDEQDVFLVQLRGRKRWRVAPQKEAPCPPHGYMGKGVHRELSLIAKSFPAAMPKGAKAVILEPGSVLYVPKGHWHTSETLSDSIALTLTFPSTSMLDVVLGGLRRRLLAREEWRRTATGLTGKGQRRRARLAEIRKLVEALGRELSETPVEELA